MSLLRYAKLSLDDDALFNHEFGDIYFQPASGFAESDHTFIHANHLPERFRNLNANASITIAEIGFGSGLNFINTVQHFFNSISTRASYVKASQPQPILIYCSVEKHPIELSTLKHIQQHWPLPSIREALYAQYPHNHAGFHYLTLHPQVRLLLLMGEATDMLSALQAKVDAWFLDGFAPAKNPDCWSQPLFRDIARCSHPRTTLSSFSCARVLRDNLQLNGFSVEKQRGYGQKRDMITAKPDSAANEQLNHWFSLPQPSMPKRIAVIGAGIAGSTTAYALAQQNLQVDVFHAPEAYPPASAVPLAVPYLLPGLNDSLLRDFQLNAWHHALRHLHKLTQINPDILSPCPIIRQPVHDKDSERHHKLFEQKLLNEQQWCLHDDALHYLQAGVLQPNALLNTLLSHNNIRIKPEIVNTLTQTHNQWWINDELYDVVILATGWQTVLYPDNSIKNILRPIRGQGTFLRVKHKPKAIYCDHHAFIPHPSQDIMYVGSSFTPNNADLNHSDADDLDNKAAYMAKFIAEGENTLPENNSINDADIVDAFVGIRCATRDYQPLLGPMPIEADIINKYSPWRKDANLTIHEPLNHYIGLYVNAGYGSKGMTNAFLNADILTAMITGQPLPMDRSLLPHILPARVIIKQLIRRQL